MSVRPADAQADLNLRWTHTHFCWFCHVAAHMNKCICTVYNECSIKKTLAGLQNGATFGDTTEKCSADDQIH